MQPPFTRTICHHVTLLALLFSATGHSLATIAEESSLHRSAATIAVEPGGALLPDGVIEPAPPGPGRDLPRAMVSSPQTATHSAASVDVIPMVPTIPFDLPPGTAVIDQFASRGVIFGGSGPQAIEDGSSETSPVLSGTPEFDGDITGYFVDPDTGEPAPVYAMLFDIGGFDATNTVLMEFFAPDGSLLQSFENDSTDFKRYAVFGGPFGIASWRFSNLSSTSPDGFGIDNLTFSTPGEDNLGEELGISDCLLGNPVNPTTGNKIQIETDYIQAKPFPLQVQRSYNSFTGRWLFFRKLEHEPGSYHVQVTSADGKRRTFSKLVDSNWLSMNPAIDSTMGMSLDTDGNPTGWVQQTGDDMTYRFDIHGRIASVTNRAGIRHSYSYDQYNITVTHSLGGTLTYHLGPTGLIEGFTDPDGYRYSYEYNGNGLVSAFTYPAEIGSPQKLYRYEDAIHKDLLTSILYNDTDSTYPFAYWRYDESRRAIQSSRSDGNDTILFDYSNRDDIQYPRTHTTNALGKETTYYFTKTNGTQKTYYVAGHASENCQAANQAYGYFTSGYIYSKRDWNGNTTRYQRNAKGQETSRTEAFGTEQQRTITTDWHPYFNLPVRVAEPGRVTTYHYDVRGNLLQKTIEDATTP